MSKTRLLQLLALGLLSACQGEPSSGNPDDDAPGEVPTIVSALHVSAEVPDTTVDRVEYVVVSDGVDLDLGGTLGVADGFARGQIRVPQGMSFDLQLRFLADGVARCEGRATDLAVDSDRTSQVNILPQCGEALAASAGRGGKRNRAPRIEAVFASRRNVRFDETVAVSVSAFDEDGDRLRYQWTESIPGSGFADAAKAATSWSAGPRAVVRNTIRIAVTDGRGGSAKASLDMEFEPTVLTAGTCAEPTTIRVGDTLRGFTPGAPKAHAGSCMFSGVSAPEHVFKLALTETQDVSVLVASSFSARIYVRREQCADDTAEIACSGGSTRVDLLGAEPGDYYIFIDGDDFFFNQGEYTLSVFSGTLPEICNNNNDDDEDGLFDCADEDCDGATGCIECTFVCDVDPNDCFQGTCDRFSGRCSSFPTFGVSCDTDGDPQTLEVCDFGANCVRSTCGNGTIEMPEQCDDGNTIPDDGCDATCQIVATCGNGTLEFPEECDDGNTVGGDGCEADCTILPVCGNGVLEGDEECDDGNVTDGDGCDANCRVERCGIAICEDFNPCTIDSCADPATDTCSFEPVANGTSCELDGIPDTLEQCQAGICTALPPDKALAILDPAVLADPAFSLRAMHNRLAADGDGGLLFEQWGTTLTVTTTVNGRSVGPRAGFTSFFNGLQRDASGRVDLDLAGFLPAAFVNRFDLRTAGNCGENRLVFTKTSGVSNGGDRMTLIFEFNVPDDGSDCANAIARWTALRTLEGDALRSAAAAVLEQIALPLEINTLRTNEFINDPTWQLREFHLVNGQLVPAPVVDTVPFELAEDPAFRTFVIQNAATLNHGSREIGIIPTEFLAAAGHSSGEIVSLGNIVPSIPGLEANLNILSCSGCHLTHSGANFVHVGERLEDQPSQLSTFMRSELEFRGRVLDAFLNQ